MCISRLTGPARLLVQTQRAQHLFLLAGVSEGIIGTGQHSREAEAKEQLSVTARQAACISSQALLGMHPGDAAEAAKSEENLRC